MQVEVAVSIIAGGSALLGSAITGLISYAALRRRTKVSHLRNALIQANKDIISFYYLEELYCEALSHKTMKTKDGVKRTFRKQLRESLGRDSPSASATPAKAEQHIRQLA